jgi:hypothetical protein
MGRPFQGRYKALVVEPGHAFAQVCHYIHLNPVRARLHLAEQAVKYPWSSLPKFLGRKRPAWLDSSTVLSGAGGLPDSPAGWQKYLEYLEFMGTNALAKKELVAERMSRGWCLGTDAFRREMRQKAGERAGTFERYAGLEPDRVQAERAVEWEEQLLKLAQAAKVSLPDLPPLKSHPDKALLAAAMKAKTSVSNGWLAQRLAMGQPASASQFARRFKLKRSGQRALEALLSRVKT